MSSPGGAKNHAVVMPDSDIDSVVNQLIGAAFGPADNVVWLYL